MKALCQEIDVNEDPLGSGVKPKQSGPIGCRNSNAIQSAIELFRVVVFTGSSYSDSSNRLLINSRIAPRADSASDPSV